MNQYPNFESSTTVFEWKTLIIKDSIIEPYMQKSAFAKEIFGHTSTLQHSTPLQITDSNNLESSIWMMVLSFLMLCFYLIILYRFKRTIIEVIKTIFSSNKSIEIIDNQSVDRHRFFLVSSILVIFNVTIILTKFIESYIDYETYWIALAVIGSLIIIWVYAMLIILMCRIMSRNNGFFGKLIAHDNLQMTFIWLITTPLAVIIGFADFIQPILFLPLVACVVLYIVRQYYFFKFHGFGFLQWILYLCTVEILPISYIWTLLVRYSEI